MRRPGIYKGRIGDVGVLRIGGRGAKDRGVGVPRIGGRSAKDRVDRSAKVERRNRYEERE